MEDTETTKFYEIPSKVHPIEKFLYSLPDIQLENISNAIHDETLRTAILNPNALKSKIDEEREALLIDLALLENTIIDTRVNFNEKFDAINDSLKSQ
jgi:hypothetical protein